MSESYILLRALKYYTVAMSGVLTTMDDISEILDLLHVYEAAFFGEE